MENSDSDASFYLPTLEEAKRLEAALQRRLQVQSGLQDPSKSTVAKTVATARASARVPNLKLAKTLLGKPKPKKPSLSARAAGGGATTKAIPGPPPPASARSAQPRARKYSDPQSSAWHRRLKEYSGTTIAGVTPTPPGPNQAAPSSEEEDKKEDQGPVHMSRMALLEEAEHRLSFLQELQNDPKFDWESFENGQFQYLHRMANYQYRIALPTEVNPQDYTTVSAEGVTETVGSSVDFVPLPDFEREYYLYHTIIRIPFFAKYRRWKAFTEWRRGIRWRKLMRVRQYLKNQCFLLDAHLRDSLLSLQSLCVDASRSVLFRVDLKDTYTLSDFLDVQADSRENVEHMLQQLSSTVLALMRRTCGESLRHFLKRGGFTVPPMEEVEAAAADATMNADVTFTERASMRTHCRKLARLVRLADYFLLNTFRDLALSSTCGLMGVVCSEVASKAAQAVASRLSTTRRLKSFALKSQEVSGAAAVTGSGAKSSVSATDGAEEVQEGSEGESSASDIDEEVSLEEGERMVLASVLGPEVAGQSDSVKYQLAQDLLDDATRLVFGESGSLPNNDLAGQRTAVPLFVVDAEVLLQEMEGEDGVSPPETAFGEKGWREVEHGEDQSVAAVLGITPNRIQEEGAVLGIGLSDDGTDWAAPGGTVDSNNMIIPKPLMRKPYELLSGLAVAPTPESFQHSIEAMIFDGLQAVSKPPRLLLQPELQPYVACWVDEHGAIGPGLDLELLVVEDIRFQRMVDVISDKVAVSFQRLLLEEQRLQVFRSTALRDSLDLERMTPFFYAHTPPKVLENAVLRYRSQVQQFNSIPDAFDVGLLQLNNSLAKDILLPVPQRCLDTLARLIPHMGQLKTQDLFDQQAKALHELSIAPRNVDEFVELTAALNRCTDRSEMVAEKQEIVSEILLLLQSQGFGIPKEMRELYTRVENIQHKLKQQMQLVEGSAEQNTVKFAAELDSAIPALKNEIGEIRLKIDDPIVQSPDSNMYDVLSLLNGASKRIVVVEEKAQRFSRYQEILKLDITTYEVLDDVKADLTLKLQLWEAVRDWTLMMEKLDHAPFNTLDVEHITESTQNFQKVATRAERGLPGNTVAERLRDAVTTFRATLPVVADLRCPALKERHWQRLHELLGIELSGAEQSITLGELLEQRVMEHAEAVSIIAAEAVQESVLEDMVQKVLDMWAEVEFEIVPHKGSKEVFILGPLDDIMAKLDDSLVMVHTILGSRYVEPIRERVDTLHQKLMLLQDNLELWATVQRGWLYLEAIFSAGDIQKQLPADYKMFIVTDTAWREIMKATRDDPSALQSGTRTGLKESLEKQHTALEAIQKRLDEYLETKRMAFPRFYFLSNDELLQILSHSKDPDAVQEHLVKLFDNIARLRLRPDGGSGAGADVEAMISGEGEEVLFARKVKTRGQAEEWLRNVAELMRLTLAGLVRQGLRDYAEESRRHWVLTHVGQVVSVVSQMVWCRHTEEAITSEDPRSALRAWFQENVSSLSELIAMVRGDLTPLQRRVVVALVTADVHAKDIVETLMETGVYRLTDFVWQQQLRYYWDSVSQNVLVEQANTRIEYGYEYEGCTSRLVITPLTDRCWLTLTGALQLKLGGSPSGPAGTGKTESSKDLAKALAIQCIVFNCSEQINYKMMGKLFSGLAQSGAWACLDEFNRIDIEVLSVIAQQLLQLRVARLANRRAVVFEGQEIPLQEHHVIITMNPGYAGRTELPDNLKVFFRPCAMMVPDYSLIAEIILFAEGFDAARELARKMTTLYSLASQQLSQQRHYDFGLRAVKSVLVMAGQLKRRNQHLSEEGVLIRAMRDSNVPKFLAEDLPLFRGIVSDLFPGVQIPDENVGLLQQTVSGVVRHNNLQEVDEQIHKILQFHATMNVRFGVALVGPAGSGKSTVYKTLAAAWSLLAARITDGSIPPSKAAGLHDLARVHTHALNPKSLTMPELYGEMNRLTQDWRDGVVASLMRASVGDPRRDRHWIVFDGPVDALWIENMNTVLDDNMTLCLVSGERIKLKPSMRIVFEVQNLEAASPATVSRLGVVYIPEATLGWKPYVESWLEGPTLADIMSEAVKARLRQAFDTVFGQALEFVAERCAAPPIVVPPLSLATTLCGLFNALYTEENGVVPRSDDVQALKLADRFFAFAFIWSVGTYLNPKDWKLFDTFCRGLFDSAQIEAGLPPGETVYDYYLQAAGGEGSFRSWHEIVPNFIYEPSKPLWNVVVPTMNNTRFTYICERLIRSQRPVFLTGMTGTGKTTVLSGLLKRLAVGESEALQEMKEGEREDTPNTPLKAERGGEAQGSGFQLFTRGVPVLPVMLTFSAHASAAITQSAIEARLEKKRATLLGAPLGKQVVVYVDDVNMPAVEEYGAQPPVELLRQILDYRGFYDRSKLIWKRVADVSMVVSAAPPGGGRAVLPARFSRHFHILSMPPADKNEMMALFHPLVKGFLSVFPVEVRTLSSVLVAAGIEVYTKLSKELRPTPTKSHYTFNLRDVASVIQGIQMVNPSKCKDTKSVVRLWLHECCRVFADRLVTTEDQSWFETMILGITTRHFRLSMSREDVFGSKSILFANFLRPGGEPLYEEVTEESMSRKGGWSRRNSTQQGQMFSTANKGAWLYLAELLRDAQEEYNTTAQAGDTLNLVFFRDAVYHVCRIARILSSPRGHALLVGYGGSGKQSLTKISAFLCEMTLMVPDARRGYSTVEFREDLKKALRITGGEGKRLALLLSDATVKQEDLVDDVNSLLNAGTVPHLWDIEEEEGILVDMRSLLVAQGRPAARDDCLDYFVERTRDNLHLVICMSPAGDTLRLRCRRFPALVNCCTIDWFHEWPEDALLSVAERFLANIEVGVASTGVSVQSSSSKFSTPAREMELRKSLVLGCAKAYTAVKPVAEAFWQQLHRRVFTTPKSYIDCVVSFVDLLEQRRNTLQQARRRLTTGVSRLEDTASMVATLEAELQALAPQLDKAEVEMKALLQELNKEKRAADQQQVRVEAEEAIVKRQMQEVAEVREEAQRELDVAMPGLERAVKALDALDKKDITEIKAFTNPPQGVQVVLEAVSILVEPEASPTWDHSKKLLGKVGFIDSLRNFKKDDVSDGTLKKIEKYVKNPMMQPDAVRSVSVAATSMALWVHAIYSYSLVAREVAPKRKRLDEMNEALAKANAELEEKQAALRRVVDEVSTLQAKLERMKDDQERLAREKDMTRLRLERAEHLTRGLADEGVRWRKEVEDLTAQAFFIDGDTFIAAAFLSYGGPFTGEFREQLLKEWGRIMADLDVPVSSNFSVFRTLGDPLQVREWQLCGLPTDSISRDSALLVTRGRRWPYVIDPQGQAARWIKNMEAKAKETLSLVKASSPSLQRTLEAAIRLGRPLLIEGCSDTLDPMLEPILAKAVFKQNGAAHIRLGGKDVEYDPHFRMYLLTSMPNPHLLPEVAIRVNVVNFTVTSAGLEEQLLGQVVSHEAPKEEAAKHRLLSTMASNKRRLKAIEDDILQQLTESSGHVLDDEDLIRSLDNSKRTSREIKLKMIEQEESQRRNEEYRGQFRSVAKRGSVLFFVIADLALVDPMYQYSLPYFTRLFGQSLEEAPHHDSLDERIAAMVKHQTYYIFANICKGLFAHHKLLFAFLISSSIQRAEGLSSEPEWLLFLRGASGGLLNRDRQLPNPSPATFSQLAWDTLCRLEEVTKDLQGLSQLISRDLPVWQQWAGEEDPLHAPLPAPVVERGNFMQRLVLLKCLKEDRVVAAASDLVATHLGPEFVDPPGVSMADIASDLDARTPCIFILSQGADPTDILLRFATASNMDGKLRIISLGQGQGPRAEVIIEEATRKGEWVLLQNCHLARSWMPRLEQVVMDLVDGNTPVDARFRLFLTSFPATYFPVPILEVGLKITNEAPRGIRANMLRTFDVLLSQKRLEEGRKASQCPGPWSKLVFGLSFFHAVVQERRRFGPLGWNILYEFNDTDLETSLRVLEVLLREGVERAGGVRRPGSQESKAGEDSGAAAYDALLAESIPWDALQHMVGHIHYGGRVTDDWDRRCLLSILRRFMDVRALQGNEPLVQPVRVLGTNADSSRVSAAYTKVTQHYLFPPAGSSWSDMRESIVKMPAYDHPALFGLHENADITYQLQETNALISTALSVQPRLVGKQSDGGNADEVVRGLASSIGGSLPDLLLKREAGATTFVEEEGGLLNSLSTVLLQEMAKFNKLITVMRSSLVDLIRAIRGLVVMSAALDEMYTSMLNNQVPSIWRRVAYPSLKPLGAWVQDLHYRVKFFRQWLRQGLPTSFPLPAFFFPQGFTTGVLQLYARKYQVPVNALGFEFTVLPMGANDITDSPSDGVYVHGLWLEGAKWNAPSRTLMDPEPGEMFAQMPPIHFLPHLEDMSKAPSFVGKPEVQEEPWMAELPPHNGPMYDCPVYKTSVRAGVLSTTGISTNFVVTVRLPSPKDVSTETWIWRGAALLCETDV